MATPAWNFKRFELARVGCLFLALWSCGHLVSFTRIERGDHPRRKLKKIASSQAIHQVTQSPRIPLVTTSYYDKNPLSPNNDIRFTSDYSTNANDIVRVLYIGCGPTYIKQVLMSVKSILLSHRHSKTPVEVAIFIPDKFEGQRRSKGIEQALDSWIHPPTVTTSVHTFSENDPRFHEFRRCASTRLYLNELLPDTWKKVLYLDADTIIQEDLSTLWKTFDTFGPDTMFAIDENYSNLYTREDSFLGGGRYIPNGTTGFNSGVMLFDLDKVRSNFTQAHEEVVQFAKEHDDVELRVYDQTVMTLMGYLNPQVYRPLGCKWNYRTDCRKKAGCNASVTPVTAGILHGSRHAFIASKPGFEIFKEKYDVVRESSLITKRPRSIGA